MKSINIKRINKNNEGKMNNLSIEQLKKEYDDLDIDNKKIQDAIIILLLYLDLFPSRSASALAVASKNLNHKEIVAFNRRVENLDVKDYEYTEEEINNRLNNIVS